MLSVAKLTLGQEAYNEWQVAGGLDDFIEHWDVLQQVPETTASGNDMFSQLT